MVEDQDRERDAAAAPCMDARRATSAMQAYASLRGQIVAGTLRPMQCLSEKDLAAALGMSRTPVREALGKLEEEGLVQIRPQFGTFVAAIRPGAVSSSQFVREALECAAVREAAIRCTNADEVRLLDLVGRQGTAADEAGFIEADDAMHLALMATAGQAAAWHVVHAAKATIDRVRFLAIQRLPKRQAILTEHRRIIDRVGAGDPDGAAAAMQEHLRGVFASIDRIMRVHPEFFDSPGSKPRPNRHRPREARDASDRAERRA